MLTLNPFQRLGELFSRPTSNQGGALLTNNSGGTISKGQCGVLDMLDSATPLQGVVQATATNSNWPVVVALADVLSGATGKFAGAGILDIIVDNAVTAGHLIPAVTNATGGNNLKAFSNATANVASCGILVAGQTGNGTAVRTCIFDGGDGRFGGKGYSALP